MSNINDTFTNQKQARNPQEQVWKNDSSVSESEMIECKLFIGGLSRNTTENGIYQYFKEFGNLCDFFIIKDQYSGQSRGFGFVTFENLEDAKAVLQIKHVIDGRQVEVKQAVPKSIAPPPRNKYVQKLFVGSIPPECSENDLEEYFSQFGRVTNVIILRDQKTQESREFGFITFENEESIKAVMEYQAPHQINGNELVIRYAQPKYSKFKHFNNSINNNNFNEDNIQTFYQNQPYFQEKAYVTVNPMFFNRTNMELYILDCESQANYYPNYIPAIILPDSPMVLVPSCSPFSFQQV